MAWLNPEFFFLHAARDAGSSAISGTFHASYPKWRLIDDRRRVIARVNGQTAAETVDLDRGAAGLEEIDTVLIPTGHNLSGVAFITVWMATDAGYSDQVQVCPVEVLTTTGTFYIECTLTDETTRKRRYVRLVIASAGGIDFDLPELVYSRRRTLSRGPVQDWPKYPLNNELHSPLSSGVIASLQRGPQRQLLALEYESLRGADLTLVDELVPAVGNSKPFWVRGPYDTDPPIWFKFSNDVIQTNDTRAPASDVEKRRVQMPLLEHIA